MAPFIKEFELATLISPKFWGCPSLAIEQTTLIHSLKLIGSVYITICPRQNVLR